MKTPAQLAAEVVRNRAEELARLREEIDSARTAAGDAYRPEIVVEPAPPEAIERTVQALEVTAEALSDELARDPSMPAGLAIETLVLVARAIRERAAAAPGDRVN